MEFRHRFLRIYLFIALVLGVLRLTDVILVTISYPLPILGLFLAITGILFFLFNIVTLFVLHHHHAERVLYVLPIYYILLNILDFVLGLIVTQLPSLPTAISLLGMNYLTSLFEISFSLYLLRKLALI